MAKKIKENKHVYWIDGEGIKVPEKMVSDADKARDKMVNDVVGTAAMLRNLLIEAKRTMGKKISDYLESVADSYGESWEGNAKIRDYSHTLEIEVKKAKLLAFDETLNIAKTKIDKCIERWSNNARKEIIALVNQAFQVNQKGQMDVKALLKLPRLEIDDFEWREAMEIIQNAVTVHATKTYLNFRVKDESGEWSTIVLNFSALGETNGL